MKGILRKQLIYVLITLCISLGAALWFWHFNGLMKSRAMLVINTKQELATYEANKKIFEEESKKLQTIRTRTASFEKNLINQDGVSRLLSSLEALAKEKNITFTITAVQTPGDQENKKLNVDFTAIGTHQDIEKFITQLTIQSYELRFLNFYYRSVEQSPTAPTKDHSVPVGASEAQWNATATIQIISF